MATIEDAHNITAMTYKQTKRTFDQTGRLCQTQPLRGSAHSAHNSKALRQRCRGVSLFCRKGHRGRRSQYLQFSIVHQAPSASPKASFHVRRHEAAGAPAASRSQGRTMEVVCASAGEDLCRPCVECGTVTGDSAMGCLSPAGASRTASRASDAQERPRQRSPLAPGATSATCCKISPSRCATSAGAKRGVAHDMAERALCCRKRLINASGWG